MARAYTPSLQVTASTRVSKVRELPLPGKSLVNLGERVQATTSVLSAELPGELLIIKLADRMGLEPEEVTKGLKCKVGDKICRGQILCEVHSFFGFFHNYYKSLVDGEIEFFTEANAHLGVRQAAVPFAINAYIDGVVTALEEGKRVTIEADAALIQGVFGIGGERQGRILPLTVSNDEVVTEKHLRNRSAEIQKAVLIGGATFDLGALRQASQAGVAAVVVGSIDSGTLYEFMGQKIAVSVTGDEDIPFTLIVTEGFGRLPLSARVIELAKMLSGEMASVNGATQVRAGALRPEIIVPSSKINHLSKQLISPVDNNLNVGQTVRVIRVPHFGMIGKVNELPHEPMIIPTGAKVRVVKVQLTSKEIVTVPRSNVELI